MTVSLVDDRDGAVVQTLLSKNMLISYRGSERGRLAAKQVESDTPWSQMSVIGRKGLLQSQFGWLVRLGDVGNNQTIEFSGL